MTDTTAPEMTAAPGAFTSKSSKPAPKRRMAREPKADASEGSTQSGSPATERPRAESKIGSVIALLDREQGATLSEMVETTGWQPHTTRAALTGLKKKGHTITKDKRGDVTCYRIVRAAS